MWIKSDEGKLHYGYDTAMLTMALDGAKTWVDDLVAVLNKRGITDIELINCYYYCRERGLFGEGLDKFYSWEPFLRYIVQASEDFWLEWALFN